MYVNRDKYALVGGVLLDGTRDMQPRTGLAVCVDGDRISAVCDAACRSAASSKYGCFPMGLILLF